MSIHSVCACVCVCVCGNLSGRDISTLQFSNVAKYGHGPPEDGFKGDRNLYGRILSVYFDIVMF
jgi:hypothetical protein